jgi:glycerol-3-phosphate dehydrogenase
VTRNLNIHGYHRQAEKFGTLGVYGSDALAIHDLQRADEALGRPLHTALSYTGAEVVWAVRSEMARTVEDVLSRRCRALILDSRAAAQMAPQVARLMARELGRDAAWERREVDSFTALARQYML